MPQPESEPKLRSRWRGLWAWLLLSTYLLLLLGLGASHSARIIELESSVWRLQETDELVEWLGRLAAAGLIEILRFMPVGLFTALGVWFIVPPLAGKLRGRFLVWLRKLPAEGRTTNGGPPKDDTAAEGRLKPEPRTGRRLFNYVKGLLQLSCALGISLGLCVLIRWVEVGRQPPAAFLLLPALGCLLGTWLGITWCRGRRARWLLVPQLVLLLGVLVAMAGGLLLLAVEDRPLGFEPPEVTSAKKRHLVEVIRSSRRQSGSMRYLRLSEQEANLLLAWGLSIGSPDRKIKVQLEQGGASALASVGLPGGGRRLGYLNVRAAGDVEIQCGEPHVRLDHLSVGRLAVPRQLLELLTPVAIGALSSDPDVQPILKSIDSLEVTPDAVNVAAHRGAFHERVLPSLLARLGAKPDVLEATRAHIEHLVSVADRLPAGDAGFKAYVREAFQLARRRSSEGDAALENRAALFALAILQGHPRVEQFLGPVTDGELRERIRRQVRHVTLRGRGDWTRHFWVSAALALLSSEALSDAVGLLKEELDAGSGSGFSFADLLADQAGTRFAEQATRSEKAARQMQQRLAGGFDIGAIFPPAHDLPEGIPDDQLQSEYGGVGGAKYTELLQEMERRLDGCAALR